MKISIFTPTNNSAFLPEVYESIKDQDFHEWIILCNNNAIPVKLEDPRVKVFAQWNAPPLVGFLKAGACRQASGDVLLELDHDDLLTPTAIQEVKEAFEDPEIGFVYSNAIYDATARKGRYKQVFDESYGFKHRPYNHKGTALVETVSFEPTPESVSTVWFCPVHLRAFRRSVYEEVGGFDEGMGYL
jgi:glycosyltransferase involved in cell wall biosynthesis